MGIEAIYLMLGVLGGVFMSPFLTPATARIAGAAFVAGIAAIVAWPLLRERIEVPPAVVGTVATGSILFLVTWFGFAPLFRDVVPPLVYSLSLVPNAEEIRYAEHGSGPWYRLTVTNATDQDINDLHVVVCLPTYVRAKPVVLIEAKVDGLRAKAAYVVTVTRPVSDVSLPTFRSVGFTNQVVVDTTRLLARGMFAVLIPSEGKGGQPGEDGAFGVLAVVRRHQYFSEQVRDIETYPIASIKEDGSELLDLTKNDPERTKSTVGPPIPTAPPEAYPRGTLFEVSQEITIE